MPRKPAPHDIDDYVPLGDVCRGVLSMQAQYGCRYAGGHPGGQADLTAPGQGDGRALRIHGDNRDYHSLMMHRADTAEYVTRVADHLLALRNISAAQHADILAACATHPLIAKDPRE